MVHMKTPAVDKKPRASETRTAVLVLYTGISYHNTARASTSVYVLLLFSILRLEFVALYYSEF